MRTVRLVVEQHREIVSTEAAAGASNPCGGPAVTARRENGVPPNTSGAPAAPEGPWYWWPRTWQTACFDASGRLRKLTVHNTPDGGATITMPPGESATLLRGGADQLAAIAERAAHTLHGRSR